MRPGRPMFGCSARRSTAASTRTTTRRAAIGSSVAMNEASASRLRSALRSHLTRTHLPFLGKLRDVFVGGKVLGVRLVALIWPGRCGGTCTEAMTEGRRMGMNYHPTTSARSHLLKGVFSGVSVPSRDRKSAQLPVFSARFRFCPGEPVKLITYDCFLIILNCHPHVDTDPAFSISIPEFGSRRHARPILRWDNT
jgi:hypothetical protein